MAPTAPRSRQRTSRPKTTGPKGKVAGAALWSSSSEPAPDPVAAGAAVAVEGSATATGAERGPGPRAGPGGGAQPGLQRRGPEARRVVAVRGPRAGGGAA